MSERELVEWRRFAHRKMLPHRRIEMLLAQVSLLIAKTMGGAKDAKLQDFLFDPEDNTPVNELSLDDAKAAFAFNPVKKKKP